MRANNLLSFLVIVLAYVVDLYAEYQLNNAVRVILPPQRLVLQVS